MSIFEEYLIIACLIFFLFGFFVIVTKATSKKTVNKNTSNNFKEKNTNEEVEDTNVLSEVDEKNISSLFACPDCKKEISRNAYVCPHCGVRLKTSFLYKLIKWVIIIGVIWFVILILSGVIVYNS